MLFNAEAIPFLSKLSDATRAKIKSDYEALCKSEFESYVPWMCTGLALADNRINRYLHSTAFSSHSLVVDEELLSAVNELIQGPGRIMCEDLSVKPHQWPVYTDIATDKRHFSYYQEGRALVRSCK